MFLYIHIQINPQLYTTWSTTSDTLYFYLFCLTDGTSLSVNSFPLCLFVQYLYTFYEILSRIELPVKYVRSLSLFFYTQKTVYHLRGFPIPRFTTGHLHTSSLSQTIEKPKTQNRISWSCSFSSLHPYKYKWMGFTRRLLCFNPWYSILSPKIGVHV